MDTSSSVSNTALLGALQLADSFFPSGMFTQSHGLEAFVEASLCDSANLEPLLHSYVRASFGPCEALAARWVARAGAAGDLALVARVDARLEAAKLSVEGRMVSRRCGRSILLLAAEVLDSPLLAEYAALVRGGAAPGHQAVALALALAAAGLDDETAALVELHTCSVSLLGAALRLGVTDHVAVQRLLRRAAPVLAEAAADGRDQHWSELGGYAPQIDILQMRHARSDSRLFVS
jgi:urease accessory protein